MDSTNQKRLAHYARTHCDVFQARLPMQGILKFYKGNIFVITEIQFAIQSQVTSTCASTIMRSFQTELFSRFLPTAYSDNVNLAAHGLGISCQITEMATLLNSISSELKNSFLPKYRVIYSDYTIKWCSGI